MGILAYKKITTEFSIGNQIIYELPTSTKRSAKIFFFFFFLRKKRSEETRVWNGVCTHPPPHKQTNKQNKTKQVPRAM